MAVALRQFGVHTSEEDKQNGSRYNHNYAKFKRFLGKDSVQDRCAGNIGRKRTASYHAHWECELMRAIACLQGKVLPCILLGTSDCVARLKPLQHHTCAACSYGGSCFDASSVDTCCIDAFDCTRFSQQCKHFKLNRKCKQRHNILRSPLLPALSNAVASAVSIHLHEREHHEIGDELGKFASHI